MPNSGKFREKKFPKSRIGTLDVFAIGLKKHHVKALIELDVTLARALIRQHREAGRPVSFTAWMVKTISQTVEAFENVHAYLKNKRTRLVFEDIDITVMVEREHGGDKVPLPYIIRQTQTKSIDDITSEIASAKAQPLGEDQVAMNSSRNALLANVYFSLPGWLRRLAWKYFAIAPRQAQQMMGSIIFTSIGMFGEVRGWFVHTSVHPLGFGAGSIVKKPAVVEDKIEIREFLHLTILLDHDVVDGVEMARFIAAFSKNIETGAGLKDN
ncbi:MAG: 2-oxo acid dehydrogenase subunit E2 [Phaeodactylibacter sp.]|nr:2-oxo acid dehydrogenase subunit E2 [Phaeodactylibacter sp.]MCB9295365.1 2-oxo acid dehydrogenase subunit E2 [Lewinellaceae bacterium]